MVAAVTRIVVEIEGDPEMVEQLLEFHGLPVIRLVYKEMPEGSESIVDGWRETAKSLNQYLEEKHARQGEGKSRA